MREALSQLTVLLTALAMLSACGGYPTAPAYPKAEPAPQGAEAGTEGFEQAQLQRPGLPNDPPPALRLRPGDAIVVEVVSTETQSYPDLVLDATGAIHLPLAGGVNLGGLTLPEAEARLVEAVHRIDRLAHASVRMTGRGGQRATVLGAVTTQGPVQLVPGARVTDVLAAAGGPIMGATGPTPVPVADLSSTVVTRNAKPLPINIESALRGDPAHNVYVHPGDHIYVPPSTGSNVTVLGQVGSPQVFPFRTGLRLTEALAISGGITVGGDKSDVRVIRGTLTRPRVYRASLRDVVDGESHDVALRPGDIIFVTDHPLEDFTEVMSVISPALSLGLSSVALALTLDRR